MFLSTKNPPILPEYAGLVPIEQSGYEYISLQKRLNAIAISLVIREYLDESAPLPPPGAAPVQRLMTCSLISLLSIKFDRIQLAPLLNNPTFLLDAVLLTK